MAIIGPSQLPLVFKAESDPLKRIALHELGHPTTLVELTEDNFESAIRRVGDFITEYFPLEEKYAFFMTQPLQTEYPIPEDAYWIRDVYWDPATTRIDDIFGAESFLFSFGPGTFLFSRKGKITCEDLAKDPKPEIKTPYGFRKVKIRWNHKPQLAVKLITEQDHLVCTINHPVFCDGDFVMASECREGSKLKTMNNLEQEVVAIEHLTIEGSWSIQSPVGCYFASSQGSEFYWVH